MVRKKTYWTAKRLIELRVAFRRMQPEELVAHFRRPWDEILQAHKFEADKRRLRAESRTEIIAGKSITITCFKAEYAQGAKDYAAYWGAHQLF